MRTERKEMLAELEAILGKLPEKDAAKAKELLRELTTVHVAAIAETDEDDLTAALLCAGSGEELLERVHGYFREEESEGHPVPDTDFSCMEEADGWSGTDQWEERQYRITLSRIRP